MTLPFTEQQFLDVFRQYNTAIWPAQLALIGIAIVSIIAADSRRPAAGKIVVACLAVEWVWTGIVYHWMFFARINPAAAGFGMIWLLGAAVFVWAGAVRRGLTFGGTARWRRGVGLGLLVYALVVYPLIGHFAGRVYPSSPTFGAPCPVTIATFGLLWFARPGFARAVLVAPLLWAAIGSTAAFTLGVVEDLGLLAAAASGVFLGFRSRSGSGGVSRPTIP